MTSTSGWLQKQLSINSIMMMTMVMTMMMISTSCQAQLICPTSSNCTAKSYDDKYTYNMKCSNFGVQTTLPASCQYPLLVRELTIEPETSEISTIQARALDGLRVQTLVLSRLGVETVNESAFVWLAGDLKELFLDGNRLTTLPDGVFSPLSNLSRLQLQNNRLTAIGRHFLDGLSNLLVLDLSGNQIGVVDLDAWTPVPILSTLRLHDNVIDGALNSTRLSSLTQLKTLNVEGNRISEVTLDAFRLLSHLESVNIARNRILALPGSVFSANTQLKHVDASENEISELEADVFNETKTLETLSLHGNRIKTLPIYIFRHMHNLRALYLQRNFISGILSNSLSGLSSLRSLDLSQNRIGSLPLAIFDPLGLVHTLSLAGNQISVVEHRPFESMLDLDTLDMSNNQLGSVDADWFQTTSKLTRLHLDRNRLKTIHPEALSSLPALREIRLSSNLLTSVDGGLFRNCSSLNHLELSFNPLRRVHDAGTTFAGLMSLRRMNLSSTCLTELSVASLLPDLEELVLSDNTLYNLSSSTFASFPGLRRLHLSANDIDLLDNATFSTLSSLELLDLSGNALVSDDQLSAVLSVLPPTTVVDLSWNRLTTVSGLPPLSAGVYLSGNPLRCDCNSSSWLTENSARLLDSERTACLNTQNGRPEVLVCHWATCSGVTTTTSAGNLVSETGCAAPEYALDYLTASRRRPAVVCPWDNVPLMGISVDVVSATTIRVSWNLTSPTNVTITVVSRAELNNPSGEVYEISANVSDFTIGNLTSGGSYDICLTTVDGERECVNVVLPVEQTTTTSPASLDLRISATSTASELQVTWATATFGSVEIVHFRLTWLENGTSNGVETVWMDGFNTSYTISGLRASTIYLVCVRAVGVASRTVSNKTDCNYFSTKAAADNDTDDMLLIIIIAASAGAFLLILILIVIIICCCCCCCWCCRRSSHDDPPTKSNITVHAVESTRSVNRGRLAENSVVCIDAYESLP